MKHSSTRELFAYWDTRRNDRLAPERADIEPGDIRRALGDTFIIDCDRPGYPFRLAGTKVCALFGRELKGESFTTLWAPQSLKPFADLLATVIVETAGAVASVTGETGDHETMDLEMLLLPLAGQGATVRLIGSLSPMVIPYWLGVRPLQSLTLGGLRHVGPAVDSIAAPRLVAGPANTQIRHGLVVYDGGRQD